MTNGPSDKVQQLVDLLNEINEEGTEILFGEITVSRRLSKGSSVKTGTVESNKWHEPWSYRDYPPR